MERLNLLVHTYFVMAIAYNIFSQVWLDVGGRKFAPTDPGNGLLVVSLVYLIFMLEGVILPLPFLFLLLVWMLAILRFGVLQHLFNYDEDSYLSRVTWSAAILINLFGLLCLSWVAVLRSLAL